MSISESSLSFTFSYSIIPERIVTAKELNSYTLKRLKSVHTSDYESVASEMQYVCGLRRCLGGWTDCIPRQHLTLYSARVGAR
jgi:hypothetical protein